MTAADCLDPANCPVPDPWKTDLRRLRTVRVAAGTPLYTAYRLSHWPELFKRSGAGDARFSPLVVGDWPVPTLYLAATQTAALLESSFHEVHQSNARLISEALDLATRGLVALSAPVSLPLIDLRDDALATLGLGRSQLVATTPQHYACSREWAARLHTRRIGPVTPVGLLWRSRIAELASGDSPLLDDLLALGGDVCVLFGDRVPTDPGAWKPGDPHYADLVTGQGRILVEQIAEQLDAVIVGP